MAIRRQLRTLDDVANDMLWPEYGLGGPDPEQSTRHAALAEVLCTIPEDDYRKLVSKADSFRWFIPDNMVLGMNCPFHATVFPEEEPGSLLQEMPYVHLIYLSPVLERRARDTAVAVVAHELAHVILGHSLRTREEQYQDQEEAVFRSICVWGFEAEAKKHRALWKRLETMEESAVRKLMAAQE